jgi:hypothetical protein
MITWEQMSHKEQLEAIYWDLYKDVNGIRPRHLNLSAMTVEELEADLKRMETELAVQEMERQESEEIAAHAFEMRMQTLMMAGAKDRETALRWIHEAEETNGDDDYLAYTLGLSYKYFAKQVA